MIDPAEAAQKIAAANAGIRQAKMARPGARGKGKDGRAPFSGVAEGI